MLITIMCIYCSFIPLNASKGFSPPNRTVSDSMTVFTVCKYDVNIADSHHHASVFFLTMTDVFNIWIRSPLKTEWSSVGRIYAWRFPLVGSCHHSLFIAADWDVLERLHKTHTWVTDQTGIQQLICFVRITMSPDPWCVHVCVCMWQLQPQTDWHLAVAVVLTAELTALIRTHPNQKETTPVQCSWAQPEEGRMRGGGVNGEQKRWRAQWLEAEGRGWQGGQGVRKEKEKRRMRQEEKDGEKKKKKTRAGVLPGRAHGGSILSTRQREGQ